MRKKVQCDKCGGNGEIEPAPLYAKHVWVREPHFQDFNTGEKLVQKMDVANCYARQGSHWIKYTASDDDIYPDED